MADAPPADGVVVAYEVVSVPVEVLIPAVHMRGDGEDAAACAVWFGRARASWRFESVEAGAVL